MHGGGGIELRGEHRVSTPTFEQFGSRLVTAGATGFCLDWSRIPGLPEVVPALRPGLEAALASMRDLEAGAIANPDEDRMVGHYWLRAPERAPSPELTAAITTTIDRVHRFASDIHSGAIAPPEAPAWRNVLLIGIGGSALGPQLVHDALGTGRDRLRLFFCDNTDPDGMDRLFESIAAAEGGLAATLVVVISKSGGTKETRNGQVEAAHAWRRAGLDMTRQAVAVTGEGSALDKQARAEKWLAIFPMWDWVGGRTSVLSAVGLLPAALQGLPIDRLLEGARLMDEATRVADPLANPAALLAAAWHHEGNGRGERDMVILPYKDRLLLMSRYLQQLVMESIGKEKDLEGRVVHQGLAVYGNKGSTDQHAYVQQLRDGLNNFFVTFIQVDLDRHGDAVEVEPDTTSGDFLLGFFLGTRRALYDSGRGSLTIRMPDVSAFSLGALIALFERAVGLYAFLIGINAYHQPGVEAGKKAAGEVIELQRQLLAQLRNVSAPASAAELASAAGSVDVETAWHILEHLAANSGRGVRRHGEGTGARYSMVRGAIG
ncbi:MAG TPA: glucose-6-phosphate isomerase [Candidatus Eisenbacteria bacterium]